MNHDVVRFQPIKWKKKLANDYTIRSNGKGKGKGKKLGTRFLHHLISTV